MARLMDKYRNEVLPEVKKEFEGENPLAIPQWSKVDVSMGVGKAVAESSSKARENKRFVEATEALATITGQKPQYAAYPVSRESHNRAPHESAACTKGIPLVGTAPDRHPVQTGCRVSAGQRCRLRRRLLLALLSKVRTRTTQQHCILVN